jgi:hypothetical protein
MSCGSDPVWQPTPDAWSADDTDTQFSKWLQNLPDNYSSIPSELAKEFGDQSTNYFCGIDTYNTCGTNGGCSAYSSNDDPPWTYLTLSAIENLDTFFNNLYVS